MWNTRQALPFILVSKSFTLYSAYRVTRTRDIDLRVRMEKNSGNTDTTSNLRAAPFPLPRLASPPLSTRSSVFYCKAQQHLRSNPSETGVCVRGGGGGGGGAFNWSLCTNPPAAGALSTYTGAGG